MEWYTKKSGGSIMLEVITQSTFQVVWSFALLLLLWETDSLRVSIPTTTMVISVFIGALFSMYGKEGYVLYIVLVPLTALVWRVMVCDRVDVWTLRKAIRPNNKEECIDACNYEYPTKDI